MNNEIQRKITSLTLMTIMLAGGMAIAAPGMEPVHAATGDLTVSAQEVGNFAGIQVIEIVVDDDARSDTSESQGIPNVEINGDDVLMAQADDGAWYAYVTNELETSSFSQIDEVYGVASSSTILSGSDAESIFYATTDFLDGYKDLSPVTTGDSDSNEQSTGTLTLENTPVGATVTVNDITYTATDGAGGTLTFDVTTGDDSADAITLASAINLADDDVVASTAINVVTITAEEAGEEGDLIDISSVSPVSAVGDITLDNVIGTDYASGTALLASVQTGDSITVNATTFVADTDFNVGIDNIETATNLANAINGTSIGFTADNAGTDTVTIIADVRGADGNEAFTESSTTITLSPTGGSFTSGVDGETVTINNLPYTGVVGEKFDNTEFSVDGGDEGAADLALSINARDSATITAEAASVTVTLTAVTPGIAGNSLQLSEEVVDADTSVTAFANGDDQAVEPSGTTLDGGKDGSGAVDNNPAFSSEDWPFIQTYSISDNSDVTITYGTGGTADNVTILYDYDDDKDISLDRQRYPAQSFVFIDLDDSLLNLSPIGDDVWEFEENGDVNYYVGDGGISVTSIDFTAVGFDEGPFAFDQSPGVYELSNTDIGADINSGLFEETANAVLFRESTDNENIFVNYDRSDKSNLIVVDNGESSVSYNGAYSIIQDTFDGTIKLLTTVEEWLSGNEISIELVDEDRNLSSKTDELIKILDGEVPYIKLGSPLHLDDLTIVDTTVIDADGTATQVFDVTTTGVTVTLNGAWAYDADYTNNGYIYTYLNYDLTELGGGSGLFYMGSEDGNLTADTLDDATLTTDDTTGTFEIVFTVSSSTSGQAYVDVFSFGQEGDISNSDADPFTGDIEDADRVNDAIYRFELEETDDNTATFDGTVEYIMINQLNVFDKVTYNKIDTTGDDIVIIVNEDSDGADAIRVSYNDLDSTNNDETISVQEDANTHSGKISLDKVSYTAGNTITVTLDDSDLNTDSDTIQTYDVFNSQNWIGNDDVWLVKLLIDDTLYDASCASNLGLNSTGLTLIETDDESGVFVGTLKLPSLYCDTASTNSTTNGKDLEFEYQDYSDASGESNESSTSVSVRSTTGSVTLDNTVYGVPIQANSFVLYDHTTANPSYLEATSTKLVIRVDDPDYNVSASGEDTLDASTVTVELSRSGDKVIIPFSETTLIEIAPDAGIFELEVLIPQIDYFLTQLDTDRLVQQGDIITVTYEDQSDASGSLNTVTDSATFDLRNGVLQSDKSVYIIGSDAIITLIEPDLNLDSESAETWSLKLVNWDSDAGEDNLSNDIFDAQPTGFRETGDSTGIFQVVIEIPKAFEDGDKLERGEQIELEYTDYGPAGADFIGDDDEEVTLNIFTSNFGATVELDQKVYSWTDKVYITIVAPDHNFDSDAIDEIGTDSDSAVNISTREDKIEDYKLVETGTDTGIFTGEVILTGFTHDADGSSSTGNDGNDVTFVAAAGNGPTGGFLPTGSDDGLTVSFEFSDGDTSYASALIRWNIGEVQWLEASYPASGTGLVRVIDPDMNFNPEAVNSFDIDVWSDTDAGGITLSVTETNEATGIFEGTVFFTTTDASSGSRLAVAEGDTVIAEYEDNTLPDPYSNADELEITATTLIGTLVPPLERAPATNLKSVDAFGNSLSSVQVDQQIQVTADLGNGQERSQDFAYLLQVQDQDGVTVSLSWITGSLNPGQAFAPAVSWIPTQVGTYEATVFVWESVDNPTALSPPVTTTITVS